MIAAGPVAIITRFRSPGAKVALVVGEHVSESQMPVLRIEFYGGSLLATAGRKELCMSEEQTHYPDHFVDRLEILWGEGFLSPGGPSEVRAIAAGIDLTGKTVLDIGCGTGGVDFILAGELGASHVVAIDIESGLLDRARARLASSNPGLAGRVEFHLVSPGPLNWPTATFDVVFSKDAMIQIPDKAAMYSEVFRVLKPGGVFAASDWLG
ncbi:MAG: hypothetical protein RLZZ528_2128, partial [Pseudomonadota bacterium]